VNFRVRRAASRDAEIIARQAQDASREDGFPFAALGADQIRAHAFGATPLLEILVAEQDHRIIGHAITYRGYDVRSAQPNLVLAALYVAPEARRGGMARQIISAVARRAREQGCRRIHITTGLDNSVAHRFYAAIGAKEERTAAFMLTADAIEWLAAESA
jgi:GNAT superfamily N-acetyltransferase